MSRFVLTAQLQLQAPTNTAQVVRQIQNQLNNVRVNVQVQGTAQAQRQVQQVAQSLNNANTAASNLGRTFALSVRRFTALAVATRAVSLFTTTVSNAIKEAIDFERQLIRISQVTGKTLSGLRSLTDTITNLSTSLGVSSSSLISVSRILSQAGLNARETEIALKTLARTELAPTFDDITETAEGAVAIFNQFKQGAEALEAQLGSINAVAGQFAVEAGDLIGVVRRVGGVFKASGGDLNELIALFTSVRATTRESAESIATGLRTIFTRIQRPRTIEFLKQFGVELLDLEGKFVGPFEAVRRLSQALAGLEQGDITFIRIAEELGGFRQIGKVIPLLQQFAVAQEALNVAQKGSESLATDAASAQAALAVRITKVKEEFLALVRSITETSSFQFFANTALNLASALIKLADALKPIIPLLAAFAAIKLARGFSSFVSGFGSGIGSRRTFNQGGKVLAFARGGLVPGSGSGIADDKIARVSSGEFVMKKSAVQRIGAANLAAMNENRYAEGGIAVEPNRIGAFFLRPAEGVDRTGSSLSGTINVTNPKALKLLGDKTSIKDRRRSAFDNLTKEKQAKLLGLNTVFKGPKLTSSLLDASGKLDFSARSVRDKLRNSLSTTEIQSIDVNRANRLLDKNIKSGRFQVSGKNVPISGSISSYFPGGRDLKNNPDIANIVARNTQKGLYNTVLKSIDPILEKFTNPSISADRRQSVLGAKKISRDPNAQSTTEGFIFEGLIQSLTGARLSGNQNFFDFRSNAIAGARSSLKAMFADASGEGIDTLIKADAKRTNTPDAINSIVNKIKNDINRGNLEGLSFKKLKFAFGGKAKGILPRPSAINDLIKSGGGYVDIDRTLLRTVGDIAYGKAKTEQEKQAVLQKYFLDPVARLKDIKSVGLTQFGKQLQASIKSGKIQGSRIRVLSKSTEVPGVRSYLSGLFGIPPGNMRFTAGASKVPLMRNRKPLVDDIPSNARFASGGLVPGTGNRDTVPAMLEQGSFVIRKRSVKEIGANNLANMPKYATGGQGDGVPALVTPGEWVFSKQEAQSIGYGKLNKMNKFGKYAKGGVVQHFASGGGVTSKSVNASISGLADNGAIQREIATTAQEIKKTGSYAKILSGSLDKQTKVTNALYQESSALDKRISGYDRALAQIAQQQGKATATGKAANRILKMKMDAEQRRIDLDTKVLAEEQKLEGIKKKHTQTIEKQTQLMDNQNALIAQARSNKQAATQLTQESLKGGKQSTFAEGNKRLEREAEYARVRANKDKFTRGGGGGSMMPKDMTGAVMAVGMVTASLQAMLPPLDENSSMLTKMAHSGLNLITTLTGVAFALQAFGVQLKAQSVMSFVRGGGISKRGLASMRGGMMDMGLSRGFSTKITGAINAISKFAGPVIAAAGAIKILQMVTDGLVEEFFGFQKKTKAAIQEGNIEEAGKQAKAGAGYASASTAIATGALAGAAIGTLVPVVGTAIGAAIGAGIGAIAGTIAVLSDPFGNLAQEAANTAMAQAANVAATKALKQAQLDAARAAEQFANGTISATDYLNTFSPAAKAVQESQKYSDAVVKQATEGRSEYGSGKILRNLGAYLGGGLFGMETAATRNQRLSGEGVDVIKTQRENEQQLFSDTQAARNAVIRQTLARGGTQEQARAQIKKLGYDVEAMSQRAGDLKLKASAARKAGDTKLAGELDAQVDQLLEQVKAIDFAFENIAKEVEITKKAFEAMNLGFSGVSATAGALSASMNDYLARQEAGYNALDASVTLLEASLTNAAQGISDSDFKSALNDASNGLRQLGANQNQIQKFEENMTAVNAAQRFFAQASQETKDALKAEFERGAGSGGSAEERRESFANAVSKQLENANISEEVRNRLKDAIMGGKLTDDQINEIGLGNLSSLQSLLDDLGANISEQTIKPLRELAKYNQVLADISKKRIDLENNLIASQRKLLDVQLEAQEISAKYGGAAVTPDIKRQNIVNQANIQAQRTGVSALRAGSAAELNRRNLEIRSGLAEISAIRQQAAAGDKAAQDRLAGQSGVALEAQQRRLQQLAESDYQTTKQLIQTKEEELKLIKEKNALEKSSIDALITGDITKFFEQQAASGAQAAIALGSETLQNAFGASALGAAAQDIRRQQEAGQQTLFGQKLGGPGGLTERAFGAAIGARGITDPRLAQIAAGSTVEEGRIESDIRSLASTLPNVAETQLQVAARDLTTANIQMQAAQMQLDAARANVENNAGGVPINAGDIPIQGKAKGGLIYANRGIFVPRGTDTVPAMLTPGEFVVRREAVQRGNNLQMLQAMNRGSSTGQNSIGGAIGMANGGVVNKTQYLAFGGFAEAVTGLLNGDFVNKLSQTFTSFISDMSKNIDKLNTTNFTVKLDTTNINVNLTGGSFLEKMKDDIKQELLSEVANKIENYKVGDGGSLKENKRVLGN